MRCTDEGTQVVSAGGETYETWHISSDYVMALSSTGVFTRDYPAEAHYYWAEGIGLVKEEHRDTETGAIILSKELSDVNGL